MPSQFEKLQKLTQELASLADQAHLIHNEVEGLRNAEGVRQSQAEAAPEFVPMSWALAHELLRGFHDAENKHLAESYIRLVESNGKLVDAVKVWFTWMFDRGFVNWTPAQRDMLHAAGIKD